jgi:hypothetical protein
MGGTGARGRFVRRWLYRFFLEIRSECISFKASWFGIAAAAVAFGCAGLIFVFPSLQVPAWGWFCTGWLYLAVLDVVVVMAWDGWFGHRVRGLRRWWVNRGRPVDRLAGLRFPVTARGRRWLEAPQWRDSYCVEEVDAFFRGLGALPDTAEGRGAALGLVDEAWFRRYRWEHGVVTWFRLCYREGYFVGAVDSRMDGLREELRGGGPLGCGFAGCSAPAQLPSVTLQLRDAGKFYPERSDIGSKPAVGVGYRLPRRNNDRPT